MSIIRKIGLNFFVLAVMFMLLAFALSNLAIKGRPLWAYLNASIVLKGGQGLYMTGELDALPADTATYLVLGSSHAYRGYDPALFAKHKISVFNAGSSGQELKCSNVLLQHYGSKFKKVILDVYPASFVASTDESQLILMQSSPDPNLAWKLFGLKQDIHIVNNMLYRLMRIKNASMYESPGYSGRGYEASDEEMPVQGFIPEPVRKYTEHQFGVLKEIIAFCKSRGIELSLVSHPLPRPHKSNGDYLEFHRRVSQICEAEKIAFYDYTYSYDLDHTYFKDMNHLNAKGVKFFNALLLEQKFGIKN